MINQLKHLSEVLKGAKVVMEVDEAQYAEIRKIISDYTEVRIPMLEMFPSNSPSFSFTLNSTEFTIKKKV